MLKEPDRQPASRSNWILWWRVDAGEVDWQAAHYHDMEFFHPYKNWAVVALLFAAALTTALVVLLQHQTAGLFDVGIDLFLALFIYLSHRWAMIVAMAWWTLEKILVAFASPGSIVLGFFWWGIYMHIFYMAYLVEKRRRQPVVDAAAFD